MSSQPASRNRRTIRISALAAGLLLSGVALADAQLDPQLIAKMAAAAGTDELQVVISYAQSVPVTAGQVAALKSLGISKGVTMRTLPIAGALATPAEIRALAQRSDVASIYFNAPLRYFNKEAREMSGAARSVDNPADYGRAIPFSGAGVTVVVNDSGVDATHDDLKLGNHVVQNTQGVTNLNAVDTMLPITYIEGVPNTDWGSGHGTHVAGTIGGTGAKSNGLYRGVAPGADLVGYGSGAVLLILDAVGGLDAEQARAHDRHRAFLDALETTEMTRSYKMLVLLAMLNEDRFPGEITIAELGEAVLALASRNQRLREDLGPSAETPEALRAHLAANGR